MRVRPRLAATLLLMPSAITSAAVSAPPEGCVGPPDVPDAYVCIVSFTPENATPTVGTGSTTVTVPQVCVFDCVGPTPVEIPVTSITPNSGTVAVVRYKGQDYPISADATLPPAFPPSVSPGAYTLPPGWVGYGCSLLAVVDLTQSNRWLSVVASGPRRAPDESYAIWDSSCYLRNQRGDNLVCAGTCGGTTEVAMVDYDATSDTLELCLQMLWEGPDGPGYHYQCVAPTDLGSALAVI